MQLGRAGRHADAAGRFREAVRLCPEFAAGWYNLGLALVETGDLAGADEAFARACALRPDEPEAFVRRGVVLRRLDRPGAAIAALRRAIELGSRAPAQRPPATAEAYRTIAGAYADQGRYREAAEHYRLAAELEPAHFPDGSDYLHLLHYDPAVTRPRLLEVARAWAARYADPLTADARPRDDDDPTPDRPLRVGYLSSDFHDHPAARLMVPVLQYLDRDQFHVFCYHDSRREDATTERLRSYPATWRVTRGITDEAVAEQIRADRIDVLVDLGGHMGVRLLVFARRPAPVQVTHFNYPDTTGMRAMDWRITDPLAEPHEGPDGDDRYSVERLYRMPHCAWCYDPGTDVPEVGPLPAEKNGYVTFTSLNKPLKHTPEAARLWAQILRAVPGSKLVLRGFREYGENAALAEPFAPYGVLDRLIFAPAASRRTYLGLYNRVDIALDPFPYNGGVTSADAMYMGVPVVTLAGDSYLSRQGVMLLTNLAMAELIATDGAGYVRAAVELARDLPRLAGLRAGLRERMRGSPLMDGPGFVRELEAAYRDIWRAWCGVDPRN